MLVEIVVYKENDPVVSAIRFIKEKMGWTVVYGKGSTIDETKFCSTYGRQKMCCICPNINTDGSCGSKGVQIEESKVREYVKEALKEPYKDPLVKAYSSVGQLTIKDIETWVNS